MPGEAIKNDRHYTYADLLKWNDDRRWELIDGVAYLMAPPRRIHEKISTEILKQLAVFLTGKPYEVYGGNFGVRLNADQGDDTLVIPDVTVVCDQSKLDDMGCTGAPDMIIEILSPSTAARDRLIKFNKYLQAGVREYWIVDPDTKTVSAHVLENGKYTTKAYGDTDAPPVHVLDGCTINLADVFA